MSLITEEDRTKPLRALGLALLTAPEDIIEFQKIFLNTSSNLMCLASYLQAGREIIEAARHIEETHFINTNVKTLFMALWDIGTSDIRKKVPSLEFEKFIKIMEKYNVIKTL